VALPQTPLGELATLPERMKNDAKKVKQCKCGPRDERMGARAREDWHTSRMLRSTAVKEVINISATL